MRVYMWGAISVLSICFLGVFYAYAYHRGYQTHTIEVYRQMAQMMRDAQQKAAAIGTVIHQKQQQLERTKTHNEVCRDILNFDVRGCL